MVLSFDKGKMIPLKTLMALLIVADHLSYHIDVIYLMPFRELGAPIVSVFFFISGFGLHKSFQSRGQSYLDCFLRRRIWKVVLPLLISLALSYCLLWDSSRDFVGEWRNMLFLGIPILPYSWFAISIVVYYFVFYFCYRFVSDRWNAFCVLCFVVLLMLLAIICGYDRCWWVSSLAFPTGIFYSIKEEWLYAFCKHKKVNYWLLLCGSVLLFCALYLTHNPYVWVLCYVMIPFIVALVVARLPVAKFCWPWVSFIASISYEMYLCQGIPMEFFERTIIIPQPLLYIVSVYLAVFVLAWSIHSICALSYNNSCISSTT